MKVRFLTIFPYTGTEEISQPLWISVSLKEIGISFRPYNSTTPGSPCASLISNTPVQKLKDSLGVFHKPSVSLIRALLLRRETMVVDD